MPKWWRWYLSHEGLAWTATAVWLGAIGWAVLRHGLPYDEGAQLTLEEWADVGGFVSAAVAPLAVLWVVRSFYVQKRELGAAVAAATLQAEAIERQVALRTRELADAVKPDIRASIQAVAHDIPKLYVDQVTHPDGLVPVSEEIISFQLKNAGRGTAYDVRLSVSGRRTDGTEWHRRLSTIDVFEVDTVKAQRLEVIRGESETPTLLVLLTVEYANVDREQCAQHWILSVPGQAEFEVPSDQVDKFFAFDA